MGAKGVLCRNSNIKVLIRVGVAKAGVSRAATMAWDSRVRAVEGLSPSMVDEDRRLLIAMLSIRQRRQRNMHTQRPRYARDERSITAINFAHSTCILGAHYSDIRTSAIRSGIHPSRRQKCGTIIIAVTQS